MKPSSILKPQKIPYNATNNKSIIQLKPKNSSRILNNGSLQARKSATDISLIPKTSRKNQSSLTSLSVNKQNDPRSNNSNNNNEQKIKKQSFYLNKQKENINQKVKQSNIQLDQKRLKKHSNNMSVLQDHKDKIIRLNRIYRNQSMHLSRRQNQQQSDYSENNSKINFSMISQLKDHNNIKTRKQQQNINHKQNIIFSPYQASKKHSNERILGSQSQRNTQRKQSQKHGLIVKKNKIQKQAIQEIKVNTKNDQLLKPKWKQINRSSYSDKSILIQQRFNQNLKVDNTQREYKKLLNKQQNSKVYTSNIPNSKDDNIDKKTAQRHERRLSNHLIEKKNILLNKPTIHFTRNSSKTNQQNSNILSKSNINHDLLHAQNLLLKDNQNNKNLQIQGQNMNQNMKQNKSMSKSNKWQHKRNQYLMQRQTKQSIVYSHANNMSKVNNQQKNQIQVHNKQKINKNVRLSRLEWLIYFNQYFCKKFNNEMKSETKLNKHNKSLQHSKQNNQRQNFQIYLSQIILLIKSIQQKLSKMETKPQQNSLNPQFDELIPSQVLIKYIGHYIQNETQINNENQTINQHCLKKKINFFFIGKLLFSQQNIQNYVQNLQNSLQNNNQLITKDSQLSNKNSLSKPGNSNKLNKQSHQQVKPTKESQSIKHSMSTKQDQDIVQTARFQNNQCHLISNMQSKGDYNSKQNKKVNKKYNKSEIQGISPSQVNRIISQKLKGNKKINDIKKSKQQTKRDQSMQKEMKQDEWKERKQSQTYERKEQQKLRSSILNSSLSQQKRQYHSNKSISNNKGNSNQKSSSKNQKQSIQDMSQIMVCDKEISYYNNHYNNSFNKKNFIKQSILSESQEPFPQDNNNNSLLQIQQLSVKNINQESLKKLYNSKNSIKQSKYNRQIHESTKYNKYIHDNSKYLHENNSKYIITNQQQYKLQSINMNSSQLFLQSVILNNLYHTNFNISFSQQPIQNDQSLMNSNPYKHQFLNTINYTRFQDIVQQIQTVLKSLKNYFSVNYDSLDVQENTSNNFLLINKNIVKQSIKIQDLTEIQQFISQFIDYKLYRKQNPGKNKKTSYGASSIQYRSSNINSPSLKQYFYAIKITQCNLTSIQTKKTASNIILSHLIRQYFSFIQAIRINQSPLIIQNIENIFSLSTKIKILNLSNNGICKLDNLMKIIEKNVQGIQFVNLSNNQISSLEPMFQLFNKINTYEERQVNYKQYLLLKQLHLKNNKIRHIGIHRSLNKGNKNNPINKKDGYLPILQLIDFRNNLIDSTQIQSFQRLLEECPHLNILSLKQNPILSKQTKQKYQMMKMLNTRSIYEYDSLQMMSSYIKYKDITFSDSNQHCCSLIQESEQNNFKNQKQQEYDNLEDNIQQQQGEQVFESFRNKVVKTQNKNNSKINNSQNHFIADKNEYISKKQQQKCKKGKKSLKNLQINSNFL